MLDCLSLNTKTFKCETNMFTEDVTELPKMSTKLVTKRENKMLTNVHEFCEIQYGWDTPIAAFHIEDAKQYMLRFTACKLTWNHIKCRIYPPHPVTNGKWSFKFQAFCLLQRVTILLVLLDRIPCGWSRWVKNQLQRWGKQKKIRKTPIARTGGWFQTFFFFYPETLGKMIQIDELFFLNGLVQPPTREELSRRNLIFIFVSERKYTQLNGKLVVWDSHRETPKSQSHS